MFQRFVLALAMVVFTLAGSGVGRAQSEFEGLIGRVFQGGPEIAGWTERGGALLERPVWFGHFARSDGHEMIVVYWEQPRTPGVQHANFMVTDVADIGVVRPGFGVWQACQSPHADNQHAVLAVVEMVGSAETWTNVQSAWRIDYHMGQVTQVPTDGISCENPMPYED